MSPKHFGWRTTLGAAFAFPSDQTPRTCARLMFTFQIKSHIPAISLTCCPGIKQNHLETKRFPPRYAPQDIFGASQTSFEHGQLHGGVRIYVPWNTSQVFSGQGVSAQVLRFCKSYSCVCTYEQALGTTSKVKGWLWGSRWRGKHKKCSHFLKAQHQLMRSSGLSAGEDIAVPLLPEVKANIAAVSAAPSPSQAQGWCPPRPGYGQIAGTLQPLSRWAKGPISPRKSSL